MADMTKQRLIGALLVLTVILVSAVLLIQSANQNVSETEQVSLPGLDSSVDNDDIELVEPDAEVLLNPHALPTEPTIAQAEVTELEKHQNTNAVPAVVIPETEKVTPTPTPVVVEKPVEKKPTPKTKPVASAATGPGWLIQVASFGVKDNAYALQKKLRLLNIESQVEGQQNSQGKMIYRVKVGPVQQQSQVDKTVADIKHHLKLTPQVKRIEAP